MKRPPVTPPGLPPGPPSPNMLPPPMKAASKAPKNMGGGLPAAIGKQSADHGNMNFKKGGIARKKGR